MDDISGTKGGVMARCSASNTCPKFFLGLSGTEFCSCRLPVPTDANGFADLKQPDNARIYYYAGAQHGGAGGTASISFAPTRNVYLGGHGDPAQRYVPRAVHRPRGPGRARHHPAGQPGAGTGRGFAVRPADVAFPAMKGVTWAERRADGGARLPVPARYNGYPLLDFGPQYRREDESGIATMLPPAYLNRDYAILVPQVDASTGIPKGRHPQRGARAARHQRGVQPCRHARAT